MNELLPKATIGILIVFIFFFLIFSITLMRYPGQNDYANIKNKTNIFAKPVESDTDDSLSSMYSMFQHAHMMIFVGFGFLMTYLKKYGLSSVGFSFLLSCFVIMWYLIIDGLFYMDGKRIYLVIINIIKAEQAAAAFLISFGVILGKFNILQLYLIAFIETPIYAANKYLIDEVLLAPDAGGSVIVHLFGAFFGLGVSLILGLKGGPKDDKTDLEKSSYQSDIFAMIGTLTLWMFWPSFNAILTLKNHRVRAIMNTYLALVSSCVLVALYTIFFGKKKGWKLEMIYIQNATLAAGVAVGSSADLNIRPWQAILIGLAGGKFSSLSYNYIQGFLTKKLHMHDTCGVFSLHGLPGLIGGLAGAILVYMATEDEYGAELYQIYSGMAPDGKARSRDTQAGFQICSIICSMAISFAGGLITGALVVLAVPNLTKEERFKDETHWESYENE